VEVWAEASDNQAKLGASLFAGSCLAQTLASLPEMHTDAQE